MDAEKRKNKSAEQTNRKLLGGLIVSSLLVLLLAVGCGTAISGVLWYAEQMDTLAADNESLNQALGEAAQREQVNKETIADLERQLNDLRGQAEDNAAAIAALEARIAGQAPVPVTYPQDAKLIALTFDDGPGATTSRLLDELKKRRIPATFFVLGTRAKAQPALLKRMVQEGHVVGSHSNAHKNLTKLAYKALDEDMQACAEAIEAATGQAPTLMRAPGGNYNETVTGYARLRGLRLIQWSVDTRDWESRNKEAILTTAFQKGQYGIRDGAIVLMHDIYDTTVDAAVEMMDRLLDEGYTMVTVPELLRVRAGGGTPGAVYRECLPAKP